ncbi:alpha-amylase family glycosyl hydrolase [Gryllotalpicola daejeonensis]|uniref:alpha-amylase family glycosyl hydrolase n=1 Tax=Gryllotalpicola daejeonensis TaxID=993087 RepID=UPI0031D83881
MTAQPKGRAWPPAGLVYGVDPSRFQDSDGDGIGDLPGITKRLDHVAALGADWLWLLPIYPSLRRDNGYDVDDHESVDPRFGTLDDFQQLVEGCHERGIRVMLDLVLHHTSERHPWFQAARRDRTSREGAYYIWADEPIDAPGDEPVFPGEESGVWSFDDEAGGWYHHQFYGFQPDLNVANDDVFEEIVRIATLWLERGVDGFRIDAAMPAMRAKPTEGTGADAARFYDRLRGRLTEVRDDVVLVAEADVPPAELAVLADHRRVDAILDFSLNNSLFLALARESAEPLHETLDGLDRTVQASARLNFVRNVDELDLEQLSEDERQEVFRVFAGGRAGFLYGRGLRRGWAPMMGDARRFRMSLSLLFALPGAPLIMYGQELGIGDDLSVEGRDACRPVMQWSAAGGGGFTKAADAPLILPAQRSGPYDFGHVNARSQATDDSSNLVLTRRLAQVRSRLGLATQPMRRHTLPHSPSVIALSAPGLLTLHNLAATPAEVFEAYGAKPLLTERWDGHRLGPFGFAWLRR